MRFDWNAGVLSFELSALLAIGLLAILVIWVIARNMDDFRMPEWLRPSPDRGPWWFRDRRLARMPELAGLDRRARRVVYLEASAVLGHQQGMLYGLAIFSTVFLQPLALRLGTRAIEFSNRHAGLDRIPEYAIGMIVTTLLYLIPIVLVEPLHAHLIRRQIRQRLSETGPTAVS